MYIFAMSRPSAKLCANCSPALRRGQTVRSATSLRVRSRSFVTSPITTASPLLHARRHIPRNVSMTALARGVPGYGVAGLQRCARGVASVSEGTVEAKAGSDPVDGPLREYDVRVEQGRLRDDPYQRGEFVCDC